MKILVGGVTALSLTLAVGLAALYDGSTGGASPVTTLPAAVAANRPAAVAGSPPRTGQASAAAANAARAYVTSFSATAAVHNQEGQSLPSQPAIGAQPATYSASMEIASTQPDTRDPRAIAQAPAATPPARGPVDQSPCPRPPYTCPTPPTP